MKKVLIIEDDNFLQGLEAAKLLKSGFSIDSASTGQEALKKIIEPGVDLILLDLVLPDMGGFDILQKIKENESTKKTPVIIFSNLAEEKDFKKATEMGANNFMIKSNFTLDELIENIQKLLK